MPEVGACRAYAVSNPILGQAVGVEVVPSAEVDPQSLRSQIRKFARAHLARYKIPVEIKAVAKLEMTDRGKRKR